MLTVGDRGAGLIGSVGALTVFLGLLLFAVQVLLNLYATSVVTAATYDAAREVARGPADPAARAAAESHAYDVLGRYGERVEFTWERVDDDAVVLRVHAHNPSLLLPPVSVAAAFSEIDRTIHVRRECFRADDTEHCRR